MEPLQVRKVRKRPVEVTVAGPLDDFNWTELADWCDGQKTVLDEGIAVAIVTLEGIMYLTEGNYVVRGVKGEYYPIRADIFEDTYEDVE